MAWRRRHYVGGFRKLLVDPDEKLVSPAIRYLAFQGNEQDKQKLLEIGLNGSSAQKTQSLLAFFDNGQKEKLGQLSRLLQDEDKKVRFCCSVLLGSGDGSHATEVDEIRDQFLHSRNLDDRMLVIETLSFLQGFDISPCMEKLHSVKNSKLNEEAFESAKHRALSKIFAKLIRTTRNKEGCLSENLYLKGMQLPLQDDIDMNRSGDVFMDSQSQFLAVSEAMVRGAKPLSWKDLSRITTALSDAGDRTDLLCEFFESSCDNAPPSKLKKIAKKEFVRIVKEAVDFEEQLLVLPQDKKYHCLRLALFERLQTSLKSLTSILFVLDAEIEFEKLLGLIKSTEANTKAEALEVLKGVLGPKLTEEFVSLFKNSDLSPDSQPGLKINGDLPKCLESRWILVGQLLSFDLADDFWRYAHQIYGLRAFRWCRVHWGWWPLKASAVSMWDTRLFLERSLADSMALFVI